MTTTLLVQAATGSEQIIVAMIISQICDMADSPLLVAAAAHAVSAAAQTRAATMRHNISIHMQIMLFLTTGSSRGHGRGHLQLRL